MTPVEWMERYTKWHTEAQAELDAWLAEHGTQARQWKFKEDGTVVGTMRDSRGRENLFQRAYPKFKVTSWYASKHYTPLAVVKYSEAE